MTQGIEAYGVRAADDSRVDADPSPEQIDEAREKALQARLRDDRHPLTGAEYQSIHRELHDIRQRREGRAYAATKGPPVDHASPTLGAAPALAFATLIASARDGVIWRPPEPAATPSLAPRGPDIVPVENIASFEELVQRTHDEAAFLASPLAKQVAPDVRAVHERYLGELRGELARSVDVWARSPEVQMELKARLYRELAALGDKTGCVQGDTVAALVQRRNNLVAARRSAGQEAADGMKTMGVDGVVFANAEAYALYARGQKLGASGFVASIAIARGRSVDEIRAAQTQGAMLEGFSFWPARGAQSPNFDTTRPPAVTHVLPTAARPALRSAQPTPVLPAPTPRATMPLGTGVTVRPRGDESVLRVGPMPPALGVAAPPGAPPPTVPAPRPPPTDAQRARFAASQRTPCGKHWAAIDLTFEEMEAQYRASVKGGGSMTRDDLHKKYDEGQRLNPETNRFKMMRGSAVYATGDDIVQVSEMPVARRAQLEAALRARAVEVAKMGALRRDPSATKAQLDAQEQRVREASWRLGEIGADGYVEVRFKGPPPPQLLWPVGAASGSSRSGDFDRVWKVTDAAGRTRVIIEAKGNEAGRGQRIVSPGQAVEQGTPAYQARIIQEMIQSRDPELARVGIDLAKTDPRSITYVEIRTPATSPGTTHAREYDATIDTGSR